MVAKLVATVIYRDIYMYGLKNESSFHDRFLELTCMAQKTKILLYGPFVQFRPLTVLSVG
jgi:hypothetical protein